jgi:hypothetical protein
MLVDALDLMGAPAVLTQMVTQRAPSHDDLAAPRRRLSFVGAFSSGQGDLAARSGQILRDEPRPPCPLILDTGPLVAALDRDDQDHQRCAEPLATAPGPLRVPGQRTYLEWPSW